MAANKKQFKGALLDGHKGAAVEVPFDPSEQWDISASRLWKGRKGHYVQGALNGVAFKSCIVPRMGRFWMLVDEELQEAAAVSIGQDVRVSIEPLIPPSKR